MDDGVAASSRPRPPAPSVHEARRLGRYVLDAEIATGGMATVHLALLLAPAGFSRTVAIKRLHAPFAKTPEFVSMFVDEARLAARIRHPNVVPTLDVVADGGELFLVMEYVHGESLARLLDAARDHGGVPPRIAAAILVGVLHGLHAAHEAKSERGEPLHIVHRDVTPHNVLVGTDGIARVLDFGIAKAAGRLQTTREGQTKGKLAYMAPEQMGGGGVTRAADIYSAAVCLWEALAGRRLFHGDNESVVLARVLAGRVDLPSKHAPDVPAALDDVVSRALARDPSRRYASAREMARAIEASADIAPPSEVGEWVDAQAKDNLRNRARRVARMEEGFAGADDDAAAAPASLAHHAAAPASLAASTSSPPPAIDGSRSEPAPPHAAAPMHDAAGPRRVRWFALGALAATALVCVGVVLGMRGATTIPPAASRDAPARDGSPHDEPTRVEPPRDDSSHEDPAGDDRTEATATPTSSIPGLVSSTSSSAPRRAAPDRQGRSTRRAPAIVGAGTTGARPCAEPYRVDDAGLRHYKKECLR